MNLQEMVDNAMKTRRADEMKNSTQLTLGELILKLESVKNKDLPIFFDKTKYRPTGIGSWRGSYCELAISYTPEGVYGGYNGTTVEHEIGGDKFYNTVSTALPEKPTAQNFLDKLKDCLGKTFVGYKGGDFLMGKTTPVWVADESMCSGFLKEEGEEYNSDQSIVDVTETSKKVILNTQKTDY